MSSDHVRTNRDERRLAVSYAIFALSPERAGALLIVSAGTNVAADVSGNPEIGLITGGYLDRFCVSQKRPQVSAGSGLSQGDRPLSRSGPSPQPATGFGLNADNIAALFFGSGQERSEEESTRADAQRPFTSRNIHPNVA